MERYKQLSPEFFQAPAIGLISRLFLRKPRTNLLTSASGTPLSHLSCVDESATTDEFESCWASLLVRYYIADIESLKTVYNAREQWVPLYLRDTFFGHLGLNESTEGLHAFFDGYVDESTTMPVLVEQYEKAVACWYEMELKADYETKNSLSVLKTPSPMEKQVAGLFARRIFLKFQEELVETPANPAM